MKNFQKFFDDAWIIIVFILLEIVSLYAMIHSEPYYSDIVNLPPCDKPSLLTYKQIQQCYESCDGAYENLDKKYAIPYTIHCRDKYKPFLFLSKNSGGKNIETF